MKRGPKIDQEQLKHILEDAKDLPNSELALKYGMSMRAIQMRISRYGKDIPRKRLYKQVVTDSDRIREGFVYRISIQGMCYIGQTQDVKARMNKHLEDARTGVHHCCAMNFLYEHFRDETETAIRNPKIIRRLKNPTKKALRDAESMCIRIAVERRTKVMNATVGQYYVSEMKEKFFQDKIHMME